MGSACSLSIGAEDVNRRSDVVLYILNELGDGLNEDGLLLSSEGPVVGFWERGKTVGALLLFERTRSQVRCG